MDIITETLRWVNDVRQEYGIGAPLDKMPTGEVKHCGRCPVAAALGHDAEVYGDTVWLGLADGEINLPSSVQDFIVLFDAGRFPELVSA